MRVAATTNASPTRCTRPSATGNNKLDSHTHTNKHTQGHTRTHTHREIAMFALTSIATNSTLWPTGRGRRTDGRTGGRHRGRHGPCRFGNETIYSTICQQQQQQLSRNSVKSQLGQTMRVPSVRNLIMSKIFKNFSTSKSNAQWPYTLCDISFACHHTPPPPAYDVIL